MHTREVTLALLPALQSILGSPPIAAQANHPTSVPEETVCLGDGSHPHVVWLSLNH
jgi:hypothetical protein